MRLGVARLGAGVAVAGLAILVLGTFLPWLRSGDVLRDSYQSVGALRTLVEGTGFGVLLNAWLMVIPACVVCVALYALRLRRVSAGLGVVVALAVGVAAGLVVAQGDDPGALIGAASAGPAVTLAGATAVLVGAIAVLAGPRGGQAGTRGGPT
ncbi:MAG TPA: hypothetical protein VJX10_04260 [Pseudonocardiaceae bacterium]|nr:hypothetical protein [Pseudonocardiaceae bacterium]